MERCRLEMFIHEARAVHGIDIVPIGPPSRERVERAAEVYRSLVTPGYYERLGGDDVHIVAASFAANDYEEGNDYVLAAAIELRAEKLPTLAEQILEMINAVTAAAAVLLGSRTPLLYSHVITLDHAHGVSRFLVDGGFRNLGTPAEVAKEAIRKGIVEAEDNPVPEWLWRS